MFKRCVSTLNISQYVKLHEPKTAGIIQLYRPKALNALNMEMFETIHRLLLRSDREKDIVIFKGTDNIFCAGGDVKALLRMSESELMCVYTTCAQSINLIANYTKPYVALMDGIAIGIAAFYSIIPGQFCIATERTTFAIPEASLGNHAPATYSLSRIENNFGIYLGLTGVPVKGFDVKKCGLATNYIESHKIKELESMLTTCKTSEEVGNILKSFSCDPTSTVTRLDEFLPAIKKCFGGASVEKIYDNLREDGSEFANQTIKLLNRMSPISLKVIHKSFQMAKTLSLPDCLKMEYRLAVHHHDKSDIREGVRALIIEKDFRPKWSRKSIYDVTEADVTWYFRQLPDGDELFL